MEHVAINTHYKPALSDGTIESDRVSSSPLLVRNGTSMISPRRMWGHEWADKQIVQMSIPPTHPPPHTYVHVSLSMTSWSRREKPTFIYGWAILMCESRRKWIAATLQLSPGSKLKDGKYSNRQICEWHTWHSFGRSKSSPRWGCIQILVQWPVGGYMGRGTKWEDFHIIH